MIKLDLLKNYLTVFDNNKINAKGTQFDIIFKIFRSPVLIWYILKFANTFQRMQVTKT